MPHYQGFCAECQVFSYYLLRGLCQLHHADPAIRAKYEIISHFDRGKRKKEDWSEELAKNPEKSLPSEPTDAIPGSPEKMAVFEERIKNREPLFHPDDASMDEEENRRGIKYNKAIGSTLFRS